MQDSPSLARDMFPAQDPVLVKEVVGVSHRDLKRVQDLVERQPALARASGDRGFGDWEASIDAASHVGNRPIAEFLLAHGARPTIFSAAMMGQLDVVKAFITARPGIQKNLGPHGLTLMWHARQGGPDAAARGPGPDRRWRRGRASRRRCRSRRGNVTRSWTVHVWLGPRDYFTVEVRRDMQGRDQLQIERPGGPTRQNLYHVGDLVFFPTLYQMPKLPLPGSSGVLWTTEGMEVMLTARPE